MEELKSPPIADNRTRERSAAYPALNLDETVLFAKAVAKNFVASQSLTREDIAAVLKKAASSIIRETSAAVQFGFFIKGGNGYQISPLLKTIENYLDEKERKKCLLEAFSSPKLYKELIEKFDGHALPPELKTHLIRFHKIVDKVAKEAADIFIESATYAGALNENNILVYSSSLQKVSDNNFQYAEVITEDNGDTIQHENINNNTIVNGQREKKSEILLLSDHKEDEKLKIPLTEKKHCYLIYPENMNAKDIEILKKQIELIELTI